MTTNTTASSGTDLDLDKLKALALAAGPESWTSSDGTVNGEDGDSVCDCHANIGAMPDPIFAIDRAAFIAAANPATALQLIELARRVSPQPVAPHELTVWIDTPEFRKLVEHYGFTGGTEKSWSAVVHHVVTAIAQHLSAAPSAQIVDAKLDLIDYSTPVISANTAQIDDALARRIEARATAYEAKVAAIAPDWNEEAASYDALARELRAILAEPAPLADGYASDVELIRVPAHKADSYCRILTILGMEEEGDPVAEVQRLFDTDEARATQPPTAPVLALNLDKLTRWTFDGGMTAEVAKDGQWVQYKDLAQQVATCQPAQQSVEYCVDDRELAGRILSFMGRSSVGSMEPGADPLADRLAEKLACWINPAAAPVPVAVADARDAEMLNHMEAWLTKSKARGFAWNSYDFSTDKTVREQIRATMSSASANGGKDGDHA